MSLATAPRVHFVGIGGAGMSAIAKVLIEQGRAVTGSDLKRSPTTVRLEAAGAHVTIGHRADVVEGAGIVVYSAAIRPDNPELVRAGELGIETIGRGVALAELLATTRSIVVAGTHGKTTTTSMIVAILDAVGADPTYLVGGGLNDAGTNAAAGSGELTVAESDESDGSFLLLEPHVAVVTNVEVEHVDHWPSREDLEAAFAQFMRGVAPDGALVLPTQDRVLALAEGTGARLVTFGHGGDVAAEEVELGSDATRFSLTANRDRASVTLKVPGEHNVANALAAAGAGVAIGLALGDVATGLAAFSGVERRWQLKGTARGVTLIDDYAHHPTEVRATLATARGGPWRRIVAVFQPHRYSRTAAFVEEFGSAFEPADRVVVTDVYGAGEEPVPGVTGKLVADAACRRLPGRPVAYLPHRIELLAYLESSSRPGDLLLTLGAGDISAIGDEILVRMGAR